MQRGKGFFRYKLGPLKLIRVPVLRYWVLTVALGRIGYRVEVKRLEEDG